MKRIESITIFRFLAAIVIVIFHYGTSTRLAQIASPLIISGQQMVSFFFVLSGFVLMVAHYDKENESPKDFYISRFARIAPVYMLALAVIIYWVYSPTSSTHGLPAVLLNATFLQAWFPPYPATLNYPAWAISVEVFFFLIFPFIVWFIRKSNISWKKVVILSLVCYFFTQAVLSNLISSDFYTGFPSASHDLLYYFPPVHFCSFFLGISGGYMVLKNKERFNKAGAYPILLLLAALFINFYMLQYPDQLEKIAGIPLAFGSSFYSLPFILLIMSLAYSNNILSKGLSFPIFILLGEASYSIYILQAPFNIFYKAHFSKYVTVNFGMSTDMDFFVFVFLLILISILALYGIEKPAKKLILKYYEKLVSKKDHPVGTKVKE